MFDPVTLDQLRAFVTVVEEGSFSAAARKLKRVQSAISTAMANLEDQLGIPIWDRSTKIATLTDQGQAVLASARRVLGEVDSLRRLTSGMVMGLEPNVALCVDAFFPLSALTDLCTRFVKEFTSVDLRVDTEVLSAVSAKVLSGEATLGVVGPIGIPHGLEKKPLASVRLIPVASPRHSLASIKGKIPTRRLQEEVQIVLSERGPSGVADQGVLSPRTWRVADLHTKLAFLEAGLGWGNLPEHLIRSALKRKKLVPVRPETWVEEEASAVLYAVYRHDSTLGPAHRWLLGQLENLCSRDLDPLQKPRSARKKAS
jgi:DNA-binding transcriptional LysR family regulator